MIRAIVVPSHSSAVRFWTIGNSRGGRAARDNRVASLGSLLIVSSPLAPATFIRLGTSQSVCPICAWSDASAESLPGV
jgi:hypothetical protein